MKKEPLMISRKNLDLLKTHLKSSTNLSAFNQLKLKDELKNAIVLKSEELPEDVITLYSEVRFKDMETGQEFNYQLVNPNQANMREGKLSIYVPIGIALFGYRTGAEIQWEMPNGLRTFKVLEVKNASQLSNLTAGAKQATQLNSRI
ncbi:GreA/GreB family elongation factor [Pedobacter sp. SAFR-022]|uniref:GreA/GreB family elongation factor n=1 Tax=Pedobacter sp. SAFR-022 TaxID=3436861 RepID=UPI003F8171E9